MRFGVFALRILSLSLIVGCASSRGPEAPSPAASYGATLAAAQKRADAGDYAGADRILADFALSARGKPEAHEISFWRALHMIDPANKTATAAEGLRAVNLYLNTPGAIMYRPQAIVLKRIAMNVQATRQVPVAVPKANGRDTVYVTREDEVATLRDQLAKANAELERIKKRLANPSR